MSRRSDSARSLALAVCLGAGALHVSGCSAQKVLDPTKPTIEVHQALPASVLADRIATIDKLFSEPRTPAGVKHSLETAMNSVSPVNEYDALWRALRACAWIAHNDPVREVRYEHALLGQSVGREAVLRLSHRVETHYYLAQCYGALATEQEWPSSDTIQKMAYHVKVAHAMPAGKTYDHCGPARFLGTLMVKTQDASFGYTVGSLEKGLSLLREAVETCPDFAENDLRLAEALMQIEERDEAYDRLFAVLRSKAPRDHSVEHRRWLAEAGRLREQLAGFNDESVEATSYRYDADAVPAIETVPATDPVPEVPVP